MSRSLLTLAMAGTALAQAAPVVDIIVPPAGPVILVGSVVGVADALTTYAVACPGRNNECPLGDSTMTLTQGPSFWAMTTTVEVRDGEATATQEARCVLDLPRDIATCTAVGEVDDEGAQSATETVEGIRTIMAPVRITAGADLLSEDEATTSGTSTRGPTRTAQTSASEATSATQDAETSAEGTETTGTTATTATTGAPASESTPSDQDEDDNAAGRAGQNVMLAGLIAAAGAMLLL